MLKWLRILYDDVKAFLHVLRSLLFQRSIERKIQRLQEELKPEIVSRDLYVKVRHDYRKSLEADHEPEEIEEQILAAEQMLKHKAELLYWSQKDSSLDDLVSVGKMKQEKHRELEALKGSLSVDELTASRQVRIMCYAAVVLVVLKQVLRNLCQ